MQQLIIHQETFTAKLSLHELLFKYNITSFIANEFNPKQFPIPEEFIENIIPTACVLQSIRDYIGRPIIIYSGYRTREYNQLVKGSFNSMHIPFNAIDFHVKEYSCTDHLILAERIHDNRFPIIINWKGMVTRVNAAVMGIGIYDNFIHIDTRGLLGKPSPARWRG